MPAHIRAIAETKISGIRLTKDKGGSGYNPKTSEILLSEYRTDGAIIHEYAHGVERALHLYSEPAFLLIRDRGLENITLATIPEDSKTFTKEITRVVSPEFVSPYQERLYDSHCIYDGSRLYLDGMREYFSEGLRAFYFETDLLKQRDPALYTFIEELMK